MDIEYLYNNERAEEAYGDSLNPQTIGSAAIDLRAMGTYLTTAEGKVDTESFIPMEIDEAISLEPGEKKFFSSGLSVYIKDTNCAGIVLPRSSASQTDISLANTVGLIDSDYQGDLILCIRNLGQNPINISYKERVCQLVIIPIVRVNYKKVEQFEETARGKKGFGSSGKQ